MDVPRTKGFQLFHISVPGYHDLFLLSSPLKGVMQNQQTLGSLPVFNLCGIFSTELQSVKIVKSQGHSSASVLSCFTVISL